MIEQQVRRRVLRWCSRHGLRDPDDARDMLAWRHGGFSLDATGRRGSDPDQYLFWHSTQTKTNLTQTNNPKIDKLLEEGRQTFDQQERKKIYQEFQKILLEECPAIFLK
jgi:ABC-type transport system substrate-binding protein